MILNHLQLIIQKLFTFKLIIFLWIPAANVLAGTCRESQLCCNGRDSSCVVQKTAINNLSEDLADKPCYCDHACLKLDDCCLDFKDYCGVLDCQVSEWGQWSACNTACGTGNMLRLRTILQKPKNGGKHCPSLIQKRECQSYRCQQHEKNKILKEIARILPAHMLQNYNKEVTFSRHQNYSKKKSEYQNTYCIDFEIMKVTKSCRHHFLYANIQEGDRITVRCEPNIGKHIKLHNFDTSNRTQLRDISKTSLNNDENRELKFMKWKKEPKNYDNESCYGESLTGHESQWRALFAPSCHGKWLRLTPAQPKRCLNFQYILI